LGVITKAVAGIRCRKGWPLTCVRSWSREGSGWDSDLPLQCRVALVNFLALFIGLVLATNSGDSLLGRGE